MADVTAFAEIWYRGKRDHSATDHRVMNAVLDAIVQRFQDREEEEREEFRGQLTAYRNLYAFLSQIIPYQDSDLERLYAFVRNLLAKLPLPGDGKAFVLDDEVALRFFRLQQMTEGSIDLSEGDADPLKGPTDVGTGRSRDKEVTLSSLIDRLNERFGTDFTEADQLFFDQIRASAESNENIVEAARANNFANFYSYLDRMLDELFIARMEGNEDIFSRVMTDTEFRSAAHEHLAREVFRRVREKQAAE
jgi:type I restriction enzyme R subunit